MIGPMSPSSKYAIAWCAHCNNYIPKVKWTDEMDIFFTRLKRDIKTPRRLYRGLWVMPLILVAFVGTILLVINISNSNHQSRAAAVKEAVLHPHPGDIFQVIQSGGNSNNSAVYTYFKVDHADGDNLYLIPSTVQKPDMTDWDNVPTEAGAYTKPPLVISLSKTDDGDMFTYGDNGREYGIVYGVWKNGELIKKY